MPRGFPPVKRRSPATNAPAIVQGLEGVESAAGEALTNTELRALTVKVEGPYLSTEAGAFPLNGVLLQAVNNYDPTVNPGIDGFPQNLKCDMDAKLYVASPELALLIVPWLTQIDFDLNTLTAALRPGRTTRTLFHAAGVAATNAEVMQSLTGFKGAAAVVATTTPAVVSTGTLFRLETVTLTYRSLAAAGGALVRLRMNSSGVAIITSPLVCTWEIGSAAAVAGITSTLTIPIGESMEFSAGTGLAIGVQGIDATGAPAAAGYVSVTLQGYEYEP